jgi:hypothetical protein
MVNALAFVAMSKKTPRILAGMFAPILPARFLLHLLVEAHTRQGILKTHRQRRRPASALRG